MIAANGYANYGFKETEAKKKEAAHEELGAETYEAQQMVTKQQAELEACISTYQSTNAAREQMEHELEETDKKYKLSIDQLMDAERKGYIRIMLSILTNTEPLGF